MNILNNFYDIYYLLKNLLNSKSYSIALFYKISNILIAFFYYLLLDKNTSFCIILFLINYLINYLINKSLYT